ncbi:crotonobetainyl-CoA:carnitine CoA-transferase CaiB-like acyl-CoA transferase [Roseovarius halotolerans]|uniref:Succinyl-CoA:(R)-benzylsuccinate CoA-transferase subunit BbsF n=1 Tax=Roseovarius halotolerans TaxID=505353 RepID=A0A1X6ZZ78_9RHOB|nr:CoA transferase [Roseovarius halotolerans]RKT32134.1 crotonobetainyl-CoA:carnitine CoA-transferase CaiB-like acyl-CoA transferase [Roseovarius halotolerans]SLN64063.1 Succinyl-CoA:(R)-benzylsuccinate CoA-transferase subunit BbsF [Roseovarius halotolerans]
MKPLEGIRVLDLTRVLAGPYCTALLADLGAEIIKLEPPRGDDYRHIGPFNEGESALFTLNNRGKKSIALNLKDPEGLRLARAIAAGCDVVVENFRPGVAEKIGLGPERLRGDHPGLVYCSISGFGQTGPFRDLPAYDLVVQAMSGLMAATGEEGGAPLKTGESIADLMGGLFGSWAIMAALVQKARSGQGATLDVAMYDALFSLLTTSHAQYLYGGETPQRVGNRHPLSTPFGCFATQDGQVVIAVLTPAQFARLAELIGQPDLPQDSRFATDEARTTHEPELKAMIEGWSRARSTEAAMTALAEAQLPSAPIWDIAQASASEHAQSRELIAHLPHDVLGHAAVVAQPVRFDDEKPAARVSAPGLGADGESILRDLCGVDAAELDDLRKAGVLT